MRLRSGQRVQPHMQRNERAVRLGDTHRVMSEESTTPDLVELVRGHLAALERHDFDATTNLYAPDAVLTSHGIGAFEGRAAIRGFYEDWFTSYEDITAEIEGALDLDNGVGFFVTVLRGCHAGSSAPVRLRYASVITVDDGLIVRSTNYLDIDQARAAAERLAEERG
jgi:ketosteroid isomerase-like protein